MNRIAAAALCAFSLASPVAEADEKLLLIGQAAKIATPAVACRSIEDMDRIVNLVREGDRIAAGAFLLEHGCVMLDEGRLGKIEDISVWHGQYCFRPIGEPDCVWTMQGFVRAPGG